MHTGVIHRGAALSYHLLAALTLLLLHVPVPNIARHARVREAFVGRAEWVCANESVDIGLCVAYSKGQRQCS